MLKNFTSKKSLAAIFISALALVFLAPTVAASILLFLPAPAQAAGYSINLQVPIPTFQGGQTTFTGSIKFNNSTAPIAQYIMLIYTFAVSAVGIVAAVVLMIGGLMWITAGGNASNVSEAKAMITASITGLVLVLTSYLILNQVNPALVNLQPTAINPPKIDQQQAAASNVTCDWTWGTGLAPLNTVKGLTGNVYSADELCAKAKPDEANAQCLCTYGKNPNLNCSWSATACPSTNASIPVSHADNDIADVPGIKECGSTGYDNANFCCCPKGGACNNCTTLQDSGFALNNACSISDDQCQANTDLINKLADFKSEFTVTGAWPPTPNVHVENSCHDTGSCVDLVPLSGKFDDVATKLGDAYKTGVFSFIQFECQPSGCCSNFTLPSNIKCVVNGTGNHFHVKD